jgi:hypothetical protein
MTGVQLAQIIRDVIEAPKELRERVKVVIQPNDAKKIPGTKSGSE